MFKTKKQKNKKAKRAKAKRQKAKKDKKKARRQKGQKMVSDRITLRIPEPILKRLNAEKQKYAYTSIQEVILELLRDKLFIEQGSDHEKETRGRPKKIDEQNILTRRKIFSKRGERISI